MSDGEPSTLRVGLAREPAALERVLRQLRCRIPGPLRLTLSHNERGEPELGVVRDGARGDPGQLGAELRGLRDVRRVDHVPPEAAEAGRELALARLRDAGPVPDGVRVLSREGDGMRVEVTGSGAEVEALLARWRSEGRLASAVRTGELTLPGDRADAGDATTEAIHANQDGAEP